MVGAAGESLLPSKKCHCSRIINHRVKGEFQREVISCDQHIRPPSAGRTAEKSDCAGLRFRTKGNRAVIVHHREVVESDKEPEIGCAGVCVGNVSERVWSSLSKPT